jgi:hypothetical protein
MDDITQCGVVVQLSIAGAFERRRKSVGSHNFLVSTKLCRKQQMLVGNNKALLANLSLAEENLRRSISQAYVPC